MSEETAYYFGGVCLGTDKVAAIDSLRCIARAQTAKIASKDAEILSHKAAMAVVLQGGESLLKDRDRLWAEAVCLSYRNAEQEMELALLRKVAEAAMAFTFGTDQRRFDDLMAALAELDGSRP